MNDTVQLRQINVLAHCGATIEERDILQPFEIDIDLEASQVLAGKSDDLMDAINYDPICRLIQKIVASEKFSLMEKFAQTIVDMIFEADPKIDAVSITLKKLHPPVDVEISTAGVCIRRFR